MVEYQPRTSSGEIHAVLADENEERVLKGVDFFVHWFHKDIASLAELMKSLSTDNLEIKMISCKGLKVWPDIITEMDVTDRFSCRFLPKVKDGAVTHTDIAQLMTLAAEKEVDFLKIETLFTFDGKAGYSASQGE